LYVLYDEIYEKLMFDGKIHVSMCEFEDIRDNVILINGVSKSSAMTGWRIGYVIANNNIIKAINNLQSHMTSNPNSIAQKASVEAINGDQTGLERMIVSFEKRRNIGFEKLKEVPNVTVYRPQGAFYFYVDFSYYFGKKFGDKVIKDNDDLAEYLIDELLVASVSGSSFGTKEHIRFSFACSEADFAKAMDRIIEGLKKLV